MTKVYLHVRFVHVMNLKFAIMSENLLLDGLTHYDAQPYDLLQRPEYFAKCHVAVSYNSGKAS